MWRDMKRQFVKEAVKKKKTKKPVKDDVVDDVKTARVYFGHVLQTTAMTGFMEEYLFRGLQKLLDIEEKVKRM